MFHLGTITSHFWNIGATRTMPSHSSGSFKIAFKAIAPPMDCPNMKWGSPLTSGLTLIFRNCSLALSTMSSN
nr:hypothetical protein Iba_chr07fCG11300 [Ipomoea batatas]